MSPSLFQIILLSLVQGAAELLPVSSTAHVIAAEKLMHLDPSSPEMTFLLIMLHTGTMVAVIAYFWKSWKQSYFSSPAAFTNAVLRVGLATLATLAVFIVFNFLIHKLVFHNLPKAEIEDLFSNLYLIAASLAAVGGLIVFSGKRAEREPEPAAPTSSDGRSMSIVRAAGIGAVQGLCLPFRGFSRSGATISVGLLLGIPKALAEEFSFALAVVVTPPAVLRELMRLVHARSERAGGIPLGALAAPGLFGMCCSFGAGLLALRWLSGWLEKGRWHYFGFYCFAASAGICILAGLGY